MKREHGFAIAAVGLGLVAAVGIAEVLARTVLGPPALQTQFVGRDLEVADGVPLWGKRPRPCAESHPGAAVVQFYGPSIVAGWPLDREVVFDTLMQADLDARGVPLCLENHGVPAFTWQGEQVLASRGVPAAKPKVVYWGMWVNDPNRFMVIDDWAYNLGPVRYDGPPNPLHLPDALNRWLFTRSKLIWHADLRLRDNPMPDFEAFVEESLPQTKALVEGAGAELVLVILPHIDRPLDGQSAIQPWQRAAVAWAGRNGVDVVELADVLEGLDPATLDTGDGCGCHFNERGHQEIARRLVGEVERRALGATLEEVPVPGAEPTGGPAPAPSTPQAPGPRPGGDGPPG